MATDTNDELPDEIVEGEDAPQSDAWGDYPLDSVFVRSEVRTVGETVARIRSRRYILDPDFQRDFVWDLVKQSKLIESCLMRIPLPVFYVAEARDGRVIVVDGLQRLWTFFRFRNGEFRLKLSSELKQHELDGKGFDELPLGLQERIDDTQLTMYILDAKAPERARLDIFERVNSGAPLTRQQMRNALYNGIATQWLRSAASSELFQNATGHSLSQKTMRDREAINRFCAFELLGPEQYPPNDMDGFLASALEFMDRISTERLSGLRESFDRSMALNLELFERHAFRKSLALTELGAQRGLLNIALFDVCSVALAHVKRPKDPDGRAAMKAAVVRLFSDSSFVHDISYSTNSRPQVRGRFNSIEAALERFPKC